MQEELTDKEKKGKKDVKSKKEISQAKNSKKVNKEL